MLSNGFAFRLCNFHNLTFRGLDLVYMPSPPGFANRDRPHARATRAAFRPSPRLLHAQAPPSFVAKLWHRGSGRGKVQDGRRFRTGRGSWWVRTKRRGAKIWTGRQRLSEECRDMMACDARRITDDEENRVPREKLFGEKKCGPKIPSIPSENAKTLEITPFYPCHFYLELCKLHQIQN